jgi:hypothetical protein
MVTGSDSKMLFSSANEKLKCFSNGFGPPQASAVMLLEALRIGAEAPCMQAGRPRSSKRQQVYCMLQFK